MISLHDVSPVEKNGYFGEIKQLFSYKQSTYYFFFKSKLKWNSRAQQKETSETVKHNLLEHKSIGYWIRK